VLIINREGTTHKSAERLLEGLVAEHPNPPKMPRNESVP